MKKGFTLIELLVVIAIIGILSGIILTNLSSARAKARDAQRISDIGQLQLALSLYYDRCQQYPPSDSNKIDNNTLSQGQGSGQGCPAGIKLGSFISQIPIDPNGGNYDYAVGSLSGTNNDYVLHASLEYQNSVQANSLSNSNKPSYATSFSCYDSSSHQNDYCLGPK
ncbi:MAG: type II secretion system protein [Patescibacteria group bacterium]|nr:type II secretion system protein [Patescibacteria group bacterium]